MMYRCNWCGSMIEDVEINLIPDTTRMVVNPYGECPSCKEHKYRKSHHIMIPVDESAKNHITEMKKELFNKEEVK